MKGNMNVVDRIVRSVIAVVVFVLIIAGQLSTVAAIILGIIALVFLATAVVGTCPIYLLFKISTKKA